MPLIPTLRRQRQEDHKYQTDREQTVGSFNKEKEYLIYNGSLHVLLSFDFICSIIKNHFKAISIKLGLNIQVAHQVHYSVTT